METAWLKPKGFVEGFTDFVSRRCISQPSPLEQKIPNLLRCVEENKFLYSALARHINRK
jgi:hypothetical protein